VGRRRSVEEVGMTDLVTRLRDAPMEQGSHPSVEHANLMIEAADEIERLEDEIEYVRKQLGGPDGVMTMKERLREADDEIERLRRLQRVDAALAKKLGDSIADNAKLAAEIDRLCGLLADKQYIQNKADYNRGHLSHGGWLAEREKGEQRC